jgi:hypothetical protein
MYLLDANVLISAKNAHYAFDIAPGFWNWIIDANNRGVVYTVQEVVKEIQEGKDDLAAWITQRGSSIGIAPGSRTTPHLTATAQWATTCGRFSSAAVSEFLSVADLYLVAQARELRYSVVTHESLDPNAKRRIKIPDACQAVGVSYMTPWQLLRTERVRLIV